MAISYTSGLVATDTILSDLKKPEVLDKIILREAQVAPIYALLRSKLKKAVVTQPEFKLFEDELVPLWVTLNGAVLAADTTLTVATGKGSYFTVGDVIVAPSTGEQMLITAISGDTLTVTRGYGTTSAADLADGAYIVNTGPAKQEGDDPIQAVWSKPTSVTNYVQEFSKALVFTDIMDASATYGGSEIKRQINNKRWETLRAIEMRFLFGEPKYDTSVSPPRRLTGGLNYFISTNVADYSSSFTEADFLDWLAELFALESPSASKTLFCGATFINNIVGLLKDRIRYQNIKNINLAVARYDSPFGTVNFVNHKLMTNDYASWAFAVDFNLLEYVYLKSEKFGSLDFKLQEVNLENPHKKEWEYYAAVGLRLMNEKAFGKIITPS